MDNYTLNCIETNRLDRNPLTGRFNKGRKPENTGVKGWSAKTPEALERQKEGLRKIVERNKRMSAEGTLKRPWITEQRSREVGFFDSKGIPHVFKNCRIAGEWMVANGWTKATNHVARCIRKSCDTHYRAYGFKWFFTDTQEFLDQLK